MDPILEKMHQFHCSAVERQFKRENQTKSNTNPLPFHRQTDFSMDVCQILYVRFHVIITPFSCRRIKNQLNKNKKCHCICSKRPRFYVILISYVPYRWTAHFLIQFSSNDMKSMFNYLLQRETKQYNWLLGCCWWFLTWLEIFTNFKQVQNKTKIQKSYSIK